MKHLKYRIRLKHHLSPLVILFIIQLEKFLRDKMPASTGTCKRLRTLTIYQDFFSRYFFLNLIQFDKSNF